MRHVLIEEVLKTMRDYGMVAPKDKILLAVSGGPDSIFLLLALKELSNKLDLGGIYAAHLDHGLRGRESALDSLFVKKLARSLGLKVMIKKVSLGKRRPKKISIEEAGRLARYDFFVKAAKTFGANAIATGHTLDDHAETVLMRVIKGSSLKGLVGISPLRQEKGIKVIRPLVSIEKSAIKKYLDDNNIRYRLDSSNLNSVYFRNVVRREILPFLETYNPRLKRSLFNLSQHLREDYEFIESERKQRSSTLIRKGQAGRLTLRLKDIVIQPKALQKEIIRDIIEKTGGVVKKLSYRHWRDMDNFIRYKRKGDSMDLPGAIRASRDDDSMFFYRLHGK